MDNKDKTQDTDDLAMALGVTLEDTSEVTGIEQSPLTKEEQELLRSNALHRELSVFDSTEISGRTKGQTLKPTYEPILLKEQVQQNNTLLQCITTMEVNIDGTGYTIEKKHGEEETEADEERVRQVKDFFDEVYPGISFTTVRRALRRDLEECGTAYLEVIRNIKGDITFLKNLDAEYLRLVRLDDAFPVSYEMERFGKVQTLTTLKRERRFAMVVGKDVHYFKEFGSKRHLSRSTGVWDNITEVEPKDRATEIIWFKVFDDVLTPYGVPRWINQVPSVLGSRKAEEHNLEFFNSGGMPPVMVLVQGGALDQASKKAITDYLSGKSKYKQRGILAEIFSAEGDLGGSGRVSVAVERFGAERQQDAMFMKYDENTANHVRGAFRIASLFLGLSQDYNFATAHASYMVTERQVFEPERHEFDEIINVSIMKEIAPDFVYRSLPLSINDVATQLKALELARDNVTKESFVDQVNEIGNLNLIVEEEPEEKEEPLDLLDGIALTDRLKSGDVDSTDDLEVQKIEAINGKISKMDDDILVMLSDDMVSMMLGEKVFSKSSTKAIRGLISSLGKPVQKMFWGSVALKLSKVQHDVEGVSELFSVADRCLEVLDNHA